MKLLIIYTLATVCIYFFKYTWYYISKW